ncbi:MAG: adenylate kinase [Anaerolineales bacterium]
MKLNGEPRLAVVGITGSGKTTFARALAGRLAVPHVELDALYWKPGWKEAPRAAFRERLAQALNAPAWVVDGNYGFARDMIWGRATGLIWLDYSLPLTLWRLTLRTWRRLLTREELWNGNRERLRDFFFSRESLYLWALKSYPKQRREYPAALQRPEHAHLAVERLRSPRAAAVWLSRIRPEG